MFCRVVGQTDIKRHLLSEAQAGRIPHAILFRGRPGCGKLALAVWYARYLLCLRPSAEEACEECASCRAFACLAHPDLHFVFPVIKRKTGENTVCDLWADTWRKRLQGGLYFGLEDWLEDMKAGNQQAFIYAAEALQVQRKLALKPASGERKVVVVWLPERMEGGCANKLLKLMEEPPAGTYFLLASNDAGKIPATILSRMQQIEVKGVDRESLEEALRERETSDDVETLARNARGSYTAALKCMEARGDDMVFHDLFTVLMRSGYRRNVKELRKWSEQVATMGRERQKGFLHYCQRYVRENFVHNFGMPELNYMTRGERDFAGNFARFVNERNVIGFMDEFGEAERDIEQNVNPRMVFFDFALKAAVLLIQ